MNSGKLRHRIKIEQAETHIDDYGENKQQWTELYSLWADVRNESGAERTTASKLQAEITHSIKVRYYPNITPDMRINWSSRIMQIIAVLPDKTNAKFLIIKARENIDAIN